MVSALPLFYYPGTWVYVDDDKLLLKNIALVFDGHACAKLFSEPKTCLNFINSYQSPLSKHTFLKSVTHDEGYGVLQHTPVDFNVTMLVNLLDDENRHNEITAMVIDYNMSEMDGFSLAKACSHFSAKKILLTGKANENQAVAGFNNNLIHRFLQKGESELEEKLIGYLTELSFQYFQKITAPLLSYLETENQLPLSDKVFIGFFKNYIKEKKITEYYLVDKQGSFLCIDDKGRKSCLILQSDRGLDSWLSSYGEGTAFSENELLEIKQRKKIPFFDVGQEAWQVEVSNWSGYLYTPNILEGRDRYFWATINL